MTSYRRYILIAFCCFFFIFKGQGQNVIIPPDKVEGAFKILYPYAGSIDWYPKHPGDSVQGVEFDCNCPEGLGHIVMTFNLNGDVLSKEVAIAKKDLPESVINYIDNHYPDNFSYDIVEKIFAKKTFVGYKIEMHQLAPDGSHAKTGWTYILRFKASGEFISEDKQ